MRKLILTVISGLVIFFNIESIAWAEEYKVRKEHPRIFLTPERLYKIKAKMAANDPDFQAVKNAADRDVLCSALMYVLTKEDNYAKKAIEHMNKFEIAEIQLTPASTCSDHYRWEGHIPIIIYDWCYDAISSKDRSDFIKKYNRYVEVFNKKVWGGLSMPANNYYGGYMRNCGLFGITTYYENDKAKEFLDHARIDRWEKSSLPCFNGECKGGVFGEGPSYSGGNTWYYIYYIDAVKTGTGEDLLKETTFFLEFVYYLIYATTPQPTYPTPPDGKAEPFYHYFPYGDLENGPGGCRDWGVYGQETILKIIDNCEGKPASEHAQYLFRKVGGGGGIFKLILDDSNKKKRDFSNLPLAYYVPGMKHLYTRSDWIDKATAISVQGNGYFSHGHLDAGSFQICRKGRWLTKEATGYCVDFKDCGNMDMRAHNTMMVGGGPMQIIYAGYGPTKVICLESQPEYVYFACDLSQFYNWRDREAYCKIDAWAKPPRESGVEKVIREFIYLRPDTLIVLDRVNSKGDDIKKTFILHFVEESIKIDKEKQVVVGKSGDQVLSCCTLLPNNPTYGIVNMREGVKKITGDATYTWRTDISSEAKEKELFLNVLRGSDKEEKYDYKLLKENGKVGVKYTDNGKTYTILFNDGVDSTGGHITIEEESKKIVDKGLYKGIQNIKVDENGVEWERIQ